ncbi:MAG: tRNA uridine-5-carboxymethylaminomethyl(34) synthesis GTPase MnmE [Candidatus Krumholzibacteria bacterium]|nr:tRNA uridine-5-carboxymethylaminomethyl(34) synthesis GTPase MnmE [Candidatus Krumholzibacteria bacterium]
MNGDTVVALSTPPGESGIAVIRISGPEAAPIMRAMATAAGRWESHTIHRAILRNIEREPMDDALAVIMKAPDSYTGEDVAEIYCHGSMQVVSAIIEDALARGAVPAGPGEFTKRAYLNGRLDLVQAEAVADLISSETRLQSIVALEHLEGALSERIAGIEKILMEQLALVEVSIDFSEEKIETWDGAGLGAIVAGAKRSLAGLLESEVAGKKLRRGIRITILGPRNAGKSSLYNALIGEERAIVSPVPGTTRDLLRERIHMGGFTYYLEDTAGIAETGCEIEARGISMGRRAAEDADLVLFVIDGSVEIDEGTARELALAGGRESITVLNKADLVPGPHRVAGEKDSSPEAAGHKAAGSKVPASEAPRKAPGDNFPAAEAGAGIDPTRIVSVSALTGEGLEELKRMIFERTVGREVSRIGGERIALNARQAAALREAMEALGRVEKELSGEKGAEIISLELREAIDACGRVTGRSTAADLLDTIFSRFCIGK